MSHCPRGDMADRPCGRPSYWPLTLMEILMLILMLMLMLMLSCPFLPCHCDCVFDCDCDCDCVFDLYCGCVFDCECDCVVSWSAVYDSRSDGASLRMLLWCARQDWILTGVKDVQMGT